METTTTQQLARRIELNRQHKALTQKRRRLIAKAQRMHPALARPLFEQAERMDADLERLLKG